MTAGWLEVVSAGLSLVGGYLAGHRRARKAAATAAQVLSMAREASFLVCRVLGSIGRVREAQALGLWSAEFATLVAAAGVDLTPAQHALALKEARAAIGRWSALAGLGELEKAFAGFESLEWAETMRKVREAKDEQDEVRRAKGGGK